MDKAPWIIDAAATLDGCADRGAVLVVDDVRGGSFEDDLRDAASERQLEFGSVDAKVVGLQPAGVLRVGVEQFLDPTSQSAHPEAGELIRDALGQGVGAAAAWTRVTRRWAGQDVGGDQADPNSRPWLAEAAVLGRILTGIGEAEPRLLLVRNADYLDEASARALRTLLAGGTAAGWAVILEGPLLAGSPAEQLVTALQRQTDDERFEGCRVMCLEGPSGDGEEAPALPQRGSSVELLDILAAASVPLPAAVVGSTALSVYRGCSPRSSWVDLDGLLHCKRAELVGSLLLVTGSEDDDEPLTQVQAADCRALLDGLCEVLGEDEPLRAPLRAVLAARGAAPDAWQAAMDAGAAALSRGDAGTARQLLDDAASRAGAAAPPELFLLRARARISCADPEAALRCADEGIAHCKPGEKIAAALHNAAGAAAELNDQYKKARLNFDTACELIDGENDTWDAAAAHAGTARQLSASDDFVAAAAAYGEEARVLEKAGLPNATARALARRAVCMAQAGATEQAIKELHRAAERLSGGKNPSSSVLESQMLMGRVFRFAGKRDQAKKALSMAADAASLHAATDIEGQARLGLARLFLEGMPAQGAGRGEALRDGREAAEAVLTIARALGDQPLEAEAEGILGELSYRAEDWDGALSSLARQEQLWKDSGRISEQVDVALRRARVASRCERWDDSLGAADSALALASRRRLHELAAQAQLLRGETLQSLDKRADALAAFSEAERLYSSLGSAFTNQSAAAAERARQAVG